mmetsp:Transcript_37623/g.116219  ORF Transcript_37623/g.116219 Transcript_37623/m.116219 type:complete len:258 (-) Transcript_37623:343-1116(-)
MMSLMKGSMATVAAVDDDAAAAPSAAAASPSTAGASAVALASSCCTTAVRNSWLALSKRSKPIWYATSLSFSSSSLSSAATVLASCRKSRQSTRAKKSTSARPVVYRSARPLSTSLRKAMERTYLFAMCSVKPIISPLCVSLTCFFSRRTMRSARRARRVKPTSSLTGCCDASSHASARSSNIASSSGVTAAAFFSSTESAAGSCASPAGMMDCASTAAACCSRCATYMSMQRPRIVSAKSERTAHASLKSAPALIA